MSWEKIFGGHPLKVIFRLAIVSVIVGVILSALNIRIDNLVYRLNIIARRIYDMGFDAVEWIFQYLLLGALIVVPIWFIARLLGAFRTKPKPQPTDDDTS